MRRTFLAVLTGLALLFTGCSKKDDGKSELVKLTPGEKITVELEYANPSLFEIVNDELIEKFKTVNPDIEVKIRATYTNYEEGLQKILRANMTDTLPDITFQGLNRIRVLVDKDIAVPLNAFIKSEKNFSEEGFNESMFAAGKFGDNVYGLPFAVSLPISYYNMDLVRAAGWDENDLPDTWEEVIELSQKIDALADETKGMYFSWQITGNWFWQALVMSQGGTMMDAEEKKIAFDGPEGKWAIRTFYEMVNMGNQPDRTHNDALVEFSTGLIGMWFASSASVYKMSNLVGDKFELKTAPFPSVKSGIGHIPAGGNGAVIVAKDPKKQAAAWEVVKFWCGVDGAEVVARKTGYLPPNNLAAETRLQDFYGNNPNSLAAVGQLPVMGGWYAFPGENSLKITDVIYGKMELIATRKAGDPLAVLQDMTKEVSALLPQ